MKRLIMAIAIGILSLSFSMPVLAADPTTTINIGVSTPDSVNLGVDINAGGNVNVVVDGTDLNKALDGIDSRLGGGGGSSGTYPGDRSYIAKWDWYHLWNIEIAPYKEQMIAQDKFLNMLAEAQVKLIQGQDLTKSDIAEIRAALSDLKVQDTKLQEQLTSTINELSASTDSKIALQSQRIDTMQNEITALKTGLDSTDRTCTLLIEYNDAQDKRMTLTTWIMGITVLILAVALLLVHLKTRKIL